MSRIETIAEGVTLYLGDCREILPTLGKVDAVVTDPPYGIGKADWDGEFSLDWLEAAAGIAKTVAVMPGTWNLLALPTECGPLAYKWTLSAHLVNGMTRGGLGFGNWIPCVVYKQAMERGPSSPAINDWCGRFAAWLDQNSIKTKTLNDLLGTASMAGRFRERTWGVLPTRAQWEKIKVLSPPDDLEPAWPSGSDYAPTGDCRAFAIGEDKKPDHPSPKPLNVMRWFLEVVGGQLILDPFMGSGTTGVAAVKLGRKFTGIEIEPKYFDIACKRISDALKQPDMFIERPAPAKQEALEL